MGVDHSVRIGAYLRIQLREIDIPVSLWDCGHSHINSTWLRQEKFCKECGKAITEHTITQHRYPHVWGSEFITDESLSEKVYFPELDYKKTGVVFMLDNGEGETGSCFVGVYDEGFNAITMADIAQTTARFERNHAYLIRTLKRHPAVVTAEVVFGVLRYYS